MITMATTRNATAAADDDLRHHETETPTASNSSSSWRKLSCRTLSRSRQIMSIVDDIEDDDEEALKWAAIERLPTYDRVRKSILVGLEGKGEEIDVKDLGYEEKRILIERLVNDVVVDNEKLLLKLRDRMERVGIEIPTVEVRFEGINVEAEVKVRDGALSIFNSYFINNIATVGFTKHANKVPIASDHDTKQLRILQDVSGCIKPGRLTLLLGPPSSGKTTLLLALAGRLDGKLKVSGKVTYNGHVMEEFVPQRTAAYIGEHDVHIPTMTVRETLEFSARCQGVGCRYEALAELSRREKAAKIVPDPDIDVFMKSLAMEGKESIETDYILKILGLDICADTFVGNQMVRGISGGQRKRATSGELLVGPAMVLFMDQISNGLDSSTTFQIVNSLRHFAHILKGTAVLSLLQPAPDTYHLFDDIILLSDGQIVYQGPREHVLDFFDHMGFKCPERYGVANFLQEVTSRKDQQQYWARKDEHYRFITAREFAEAFQSFHIGCANLKELSIPFDRSRNHPAALTTKKYGAGKKELFKACLSREYLLMKRNSSLYITEIAKLLITAILTMTVFLRTNMHKDSTRDGTIYMGALFFTISRMLFSEIPELSLTVLRLPVFYKHRDLHFFPTWAIALSHWILKIPITIPIVGLWMFPTYYGIGYDPSITRFLKQYLLLFLVCQMASGLHRFVGAACRDMGLACTYAFNGITLLFVLGGFVLSRENVKSWWVWGYWISPLMYAQNGIAVNEFLGKSWSHALPNGTEPIGVTVLKSKGLFPNASWYWLSIGALIGFTILFNILYALALSFLHPFRKSRAVMIADTQFHVNEKHSNGAELHHRGMILPFDRHFITFSDMAYSIDMPKEMRKRGVEEDRLELVKGVSGAFRPGVLTALMGVSGAGKTTLLDVLAGRKTGGYIEGDIKVSGWPKKQETFARIAGYCEQNDIHSPHVTVYESMIYSAWLRLSPEVDASTRKIFVNEVMELLELTPLSGMLVGLPGVSGLSIEQRKRLTIAVELVANPSIIFMDEPTSGLDARAAAIVMRTVRNTVDTGRTVVCTIHQPSIEIFEDFDELLLLKRGGKEIYVGPLGEHSCHLIEYFEGVEGVSKIKDGVNPADWMLDVTAPAQELALGVDFAEIYRNSDQFRRTNAVIQELNMPQDGSIQLSFPTKYSQPFFTQLVACLWKQHWSYWHNSSYNRRRLITAVIMATVLGSIFWDLGTNLTSKQDLFNSMGSVYIAAVFFALQNCSAVQPEVTVERTVLYRERGGGMYSVAAYALAQLMIEIPYVMVQTLLYGVIVYAMMGFEWAAAKFFWFMFFMFFTFLYCTYFGMMTVAISPDGSICIVVSSFFYGLWNLFSGFVIPRPMIPIWWRWQYWTNPIAWSLYGLLASQYGDVNDVLLDAGMTVQQFVGQFYGVRRDFLGAISGGVVGYSLLFAFMFAFFVTVFDFQKR